MKTAHELWKQSSSKEEYKKLLIEHGLIIKKNPMNISDQDRKRAEEHFPYAYPDALELDRKSYLLACSDKNEEMEKAMPLFTDWCAKNGWCFYSGPNMWENKSRGLVHVTTSELYQLYKQQKS